MHTSCFKKNDHNGMQETSAGKRWLRVYVTMCYHLLRLQLYGQRTQVHNMTQATNTRKRRHSQITFLGEALEVIIAITHSNG